MAKRPSPELQARRAYVAALKPGDLVWHGGGYTGNSTRGRVVACNLAGDFPLVVASFSDCNNPHREYAEQFNADGYALLGDHPISFHRVLLEPPLPHPTPKERK